MQHTSQCERFGQESDQCFCSVIGTETALPGCDETEWAAALCVLTREDFYPHVPQMPDSTPAYDAQKRDLKPGVRR